MISIRVRLKYFITRNKYKRKNHNYIHKKRNEQSKTLHNFVISIRRWCDVSPPCGQNVYYNNKADTETLLKVNMLHHIAKVFKVLDSLWRL